MVGFGFRTQQLRLEVSIYISTTKCILKCMVLATKMLTMTIAVVDAAATNVAVAVAFTY